MTNDNVIEELLGNIKQYVSKLPKINYELIEIQERLNSIELKQRTDEEYPELDHQLFQVDENKFGNDLAGRLELIKYYSAMASIIKLQVEDINKVIDEIENNQKLYDNLQL